MCKQPPKSHKIRIIFSYTCAALSALSSFLYFTPWLFDPRTVLGLHLFALIWFALAWILLIVIVCFCFTQAKSRRKHYAISCGIITLTYLAIGIGLSQGFQITI